MNRVVLVGRITKDPELRNSPNGVAFVTFSVAVNRPVANAQGERVADFINCVAFNKQAENMCRFIKKGNLIGVDGKLQTRSYQAQDGTNRNVTEVICDSVTFLEPKSSQNNAPQNGGYNNYNNNYNGGYNNNGYNNNGYNNGYNNNGYGNNSNYGNNGYQQPQGQFQGNGYNRPQPSPVQPNPVEPQPKVEQKTNDNAFGEVEDQYNISDEDLPF